MKEEVRLLENSQLLCYFLISRDNLISLKRALNERANKDNQEIKELFDMENKQYEALITEIYRRMNYGRKGR